MTAHRRPLASTNDRVAARMHTTACRLLAIACISLGLAISLTGCSMGRAEWYETYTADGGNWQRIDLEHGRVGSAFSNAGVRRTLSDEAPPAELATPSE